MESRIRTAGILLAGGHILLELFTEFSVWGIPGCKLEPGKSVDQPNPREH
jgi:hypothetical protein